MYVLVAYKDKENQMKNDSARVVTTLYSCILDAGGQLTIAGGWVWGKIKLLWKSLVPARKRKIHSKMNVLEWSHQISHCKSMQIFYDAQGKLTPQSKVGSTLN